MTATAEQTSTLSVIANRAELVEYLGAAGIVVKTNMPKPVLGCVRLVADGGALQMDCTDLSSRFRRTARKVQIEAAGTTCVPVRDLYKYLTLLDDEIVTVSVDGGQLTIKGQDSVRKFPTQDASEFPPNPPEEKELAKFIISLDGLRLAHRFVSHAFDMESKFNTLNTGILFDRVPKKDVVALVATTGKIMATVGVTAQVNGSELNILIPGKMLGEVMRSLEDAEGDVAMGIANGSVRFECGDAVAWCQRLEGTFYPWQDVVPKDQTTFAKLAREDLIAKLRIVADAADENTRGTQFSLSKLGLAMENASDTRGSSSTKIICKVEGPDVTWGTKARWMIDALSGMVGDEVEIGWSAANRPAKITCGEMVEVIMPVNM